VSDRLRWQYCVVNIGSFNAMQRLGHVLGALGGEGWELVSVYDKASNWLQGMEKGFMLFKRPVLPGEEPQGDWAEIWDTNRVDMAARGETYDPKAVPWA
jgi:hypothetical protein